ncbi:hypothetical protein ACHAXS_004473 [Conticribra weissflogii]
MSWKASLSRHLPVLRFFGCPKSPASRGLIVADIVDEGGTAASERSGTSRRSNRGDFPPVLISQILWGEAVACLDVAMAADG